MLVAAAVAGCAHGEPTFTEAAPTPKPEPPALYRSVERERFWYRPDVRCSNGPFELPVALPAARWGAQVTVSAIGPRTFPGHLDVVADGNSRPSWRWSPPDVPDARCHATGEEVGATAVAPPATAPASAAAKRAAGPARPASAPLAAATRLTALTTRPVLARDARPFSLGGTFLGARPEMTGDVPDLAGDRCWHSSGAYPKSPLLVRVWFPVVRDLEHVVFEVVVSEIVPTISDEAFAAALVERKRRDQDAAQARAAECATNPRDARCYVGCAHAGKPVIVTHAATPPPALRPETPPPRPDAKASWIPGSWRWDAEGYHWDPGFWRIPREEVAIAVAPPVPRAPPERFVAPPPVRFVAPPPVRIEALPPAPQPGVFWVPGRWCWTGGVWVWTPGAWVVPPSPNEHWLPPRILFGPAGPRHFPGGWIRR